MVKRLSCLLGIFFLVSLVTPGWSQMQSSSPSESSTPKGSVKPQEQQPTYPQGTAPSEADNMVYPRYNLEGMPITRPDRQNPFGRPSFPAPSAPTGQWGASQPASEPASRPATEPASRPASQ